jgi:AAA ATPase domain
LQEHVLLGRAAESERIAAELEVSRRNSVSATLRIAGLSGSGKTALLHAAGASARAMGWYAAFAGAHLVQERLPLAVVKRLMESVEAGLGDIASRYIPHMTAPKTAGAFEEKFYRLIESLLIDFPVLLVVDDAQWLDPESERVLTHAIALYAQRPLVLLIGERGRAAKRFPGPGPVDVALTELDDDAIGAIARAGYPQVPDEAIDGIVRIANGHPLTATILAREARRTGKVSNSIRAVVAQRVEALEPKSREFIRLCSLVEDPLEKRLLTKLANSEGVDLQGIFAELPEFFAIEGDRTFFAHAAIAEAIRQTIPVDVPYRKRVLDALETLDLRTLDEYERVARQAAACGERGVERDALLALARESLTEQAWSLAAGAFARAFAIAEPLDEDFAKSYAAYAAALISDDQPSAACEVLESALELARQLSLEGGFGELAASYIIAIWYGEDFAAIPKVFARYIGDAVTPADRLALHSTLAFYYGLSLDVDHFEEAKRDALSYAGGPGTAAALQRLYIGEAHLHSRLGHYSLAKEAVDKAEELVDRRQPMRVASFNLTKALVDYQQVGIAPVLAYVDAHPFIDAGESHYTYDRFVRGYAFVILGRLDDALLIVEDAFMRRIDRASARRILGVSAAVSALRQVPSAHTALIEEAVASVFSSESESVVPLAAWWAAAVALERPDEARRVARAVAERARHPLQPTTLFVPLPLALYAERAKDEEMLERILNDSLFEEPTRWQSAQLAVARGIAEKTLERETAPATLLRAVDELASVGASLFNAIAARYAGTLDTSQRALLNFAGMDGAVDENRPSPRDAQIGQLLSSGLAPSEVAQSLALSLRTVEYHIERIRERAAVESA